METDGDLGGRHFLRNRTGTSPPPRVSEDGNDASRTRQVVHTPLLVRREWGTGDREHIG